MIMNSDKMLTKKKKMKTEFEFEFKVLKQLL